MAETEGGIIKFESAVKAKLKDTIADLIPEDRWDFIVEGTTREFLEKDLPQMVKNELAARYTKAIKEVLDGPEWQSKWDSKTNTQAASEMVKKLAVDAAPLVFEQVIANVLQSQLYSLRNQLNNR